MVAKKNKFSLYSLQNIGVVTKNWEEYEFDSQFLRGTEYEIKVLDSYNNGTTRRSEIGKSRAEQLKIAHSLRKQFGKEAIIVLEPIEKYKYEGTVLVTEDDIVNSDESLIESYKIVLKDFVKNIKDNIYEHIDFRLDWAVKEDNTILVKDINWEAAILNADR